MSKDHEQVVTIHMYTPHQCCPACLDPIRPKGDMKEHRGQNPLCIPLLYKFCRMKVPKEGSGKVKVFSHVYYRTPCGLCLRSMLTVEDYLYQTQCDFLYLEMFCLDPLVSVTTTYKHLPCKIYILDLAQGKENQQVSCTNEYNNTRPLAVTYTSNRVVTGGISINTSLDFMMGCDCTDGCRDSVFCSCRQLTIQTTALSPGGPGDVSAGYTHKRLNGRITTGLYECNALCQCHPRTCSNRVVQHGIQLRLQVFMTRFKGYGIRCLDDVAEGTFVCAFSEPIKTATPKRKNATDTPAREKAGEESTDVIAETTPTTTRGFFDGEERCYNIDAMMAGNLARYFNHSCSPNLFEQNVFVDTHDPRFPWLAFFSNKCIKAGTELTWDYRSVIGGAQGVSTGQRCRCGSKNCYDKL